MNKRKLIVIFAVGAAIILLLWMVRPFEDQNADEARCENWQRTAVMIARLQQAQNRFPSAFDQLLQLSTLRQKYETKHEGLEETLLASGYLTKTTIAVTNYTAHRGQFYLRVRKALGVDEPWAYQIRSNQIILTCRHAFAPQARKIFQEIDKSFEAASLIAP